MKLVGVSSTRLLRLFREPEFDIEACLKFVEYDQDNDSFRMRFELFPDDGEQQILAAWTITLRRVNNCSHFEDHREQN